MRPNYAHIYGDRDGHSIPHFEKIEDACRYYETHQDHEKLIFIHEGTYFPEPLVIHSAVQIIGAGLFIFFPGFFELKW